MILVGRHREPERHTPSLQGKEKERQNKLLKCWLTIISKPSIIAVWVTAIEAEVTKFILINSDIFFHRMVTTTGQSSCLPTNEQNW